VAIVRDLLRDQVKRAVMDRVVQGDLPGLARINESTLADELGVSRTPLREALLNLEAEGFVESFPGKGFSVPPMTPREVREIYPIVSALEGLALRTGERRPDPDAAEAVNEELLASQDDPARCLELDKQFHATLVEGCDNARLRELIASLKRMMQRYEYAYMRRTTEDKSAPRTIPTSVEEHRRILDELRVGHVGGAVEALDLNWSYGMERLLEILEGR
jgi:DNA-binding GntR family transcriptional regulator